MLGYVFFYPMSQFLKKLKKLQKDPKKYYKTVLKKQLKAKWKTILNEIHLPSLDQLGNPVLSESPGFGDIEFTSVLVQFIEGLQSIVITSHQGSQVLVYSLILTL